MALLNQNGNYIKINKEAIKLALTYVRYHTYQNQNKRLNPTEFDNSIEQTVFVDISDEQLNDIVTWLYNKIKELDEFNGCKDI